MAATEFNLRYVIVLAGLLSAPFFITQISMGALNSVSHHIFYLVAVLAATFTANSFLKIMRQMGNNYLAWGVIFGNLALICNLLFWAIAPGSEFKYYLIPLYWLSAACYALSHASHILDYYQGVESTMLQSGVVVVSAIIVLAIALAAWVGWEPHRIL